MSESQKYGTFACEIGVLGADARITCTDSA